MDIFDFLVKHFKYSQGVATDIFSHSEECKKLNNKYLYPYDDGDGTYDPPIDVSMIHHEHMEEHIGYIMKKLQCDLVSNKPCNNCGFYKTFPDYVRSSEGKWIDNPLKKYVKPIEMSDSLKKL